MTNIPNTSSNELKALAQSNNKEDRVRAALDENAGQDILAKLMQDEAWEVREAVAKKGFGLETLVNDPVINVANAANEKNTELFINDPDNIARYKSLVTQIVDGCTNDQAIIVEPSGYDDYFSADTVLKWYNEYCELSDKNDVSFNDFILNAIIGDEYGFFRNSVDYEEDYILKQIEKVINAEQPDLMPIFEDRKDSVPSYDILEEGGLQSESINVEAFLSNNYHVNLMFSTPNENNYDMGAIPSMFYESTEKSSDFEYFTDNALTYLVHQQGYKMEDVYRLLCDPEAPNDSKFLKSVVEELDNFPYYSMAELTAMVSMSGKNLIDTLDAIANGKDYIELSKDTMIGLYNEWQGTGSTLDIQLEKNMVIPASMVRNVQFEGDHRDVVRCNNGYSVNSVYGLTGKCWEGEISTTTNAPELMKEDMKETQASLCKFNKQAKAREDHERD